MVKCGICEKVGPDDVEQLSDAWWWPFFWLDEKTPGEGMICPDCFAEYTDRSSDPILRPGVVLPVVRGGSPTPDPDMKDLSVRVKDEHRRQLKVIAIREKSSMTRIIRQEIISLTEKINDSGDFINENPSFPVSFEGEVKQISFKIDKATHIKLRIAAIRYDTTVEFMLADHLDRYIDINS